MMVATMTYAYLVEPVCLLHQEQHALERPAMQAAEVEPKPPELERM